MGKAKASKFIRQFAGYFLVGGMAAIVEWVSFFICNKIIMTNYLLATVFAFILATFTNWAIGRKTIFQKANKLKNRFTEIRLIYLVSGTGLLLNLILMYFLVGYFMFNAMFAKIAATGIVFLWNFLMRKYYVYKI